MNGRRSDAEVALAAGRRGDTIVGEETGTTGGSGSRRWLVDPLCGMVNFAARTPLVAVNVALVEVNCDGPLEEEFVGPQLLIDHDFRTVFSPRVPSTTLAVAWVAAGRRAGYVSDGDFVDDVHLAAGIGLCRSAGCIVTALDGGPLNETRGLIAAADPETHGRLVRLVRPHLDAVRGSASSLGS